MDRSVGGKRFRMFFGKRGGGKTQQIVESVGRGDVIIVATARDAKRVRVMLEELRPDDAESVRVMCIADALSGGAVGIDVNAVYIDDLERVIGTLFAGMMPKNIVASITWGGVK